MLAARCRSLLVAIAVVLAACQPRPAPSFSPSSITTPPAADPATSAELEAIRFRTDLALQADLAHVRAVALDPTATSSDFAVPLLPAELQELQRRIVNSEAVRGFVFEEAEAHPDDYCGAYIDHENGGAVTSMWKANLQLHAAAIVLEANTLAGLAFRSCRFSETELAALTEAIGNADRDWMLEIPARATSWGTDTINNRISMNISSAVPDAAALVRAHLERQFNLADGMLVVTSDGTGAALRPGGSIRIFVVGPDGEPVGPNDLGLNWISQDLPGLRCGVGDMGYGISGTGKPTKLPCQAGVWLLQVFDDGIEDVIGEGTIELGAGKTVDLTIELERDP